MSYKDKIYNNLPYYLQSKIFSYYCSTLFNKRYGDKFDRYLDKLITMESWSRSDLIAYQNNELNKLINHCFSTVEYYNELMKSRKLSPKDFNSIDDLRKLPILTKDIVRKNTNKLISTKYKNKLMHGHTSGTTGSPLDVFWDKNMWFWNHAFDWRQKTWAGMKLGDPICVLLGRTIVSPSRKNPPFWQYNSYENQLWISSFHLSKQNVPFILKKIQEFNPKFIEGYPSTLSVLADLSNQMGANLALDASFTSSEPLLEPQKESMRNAYQCDNFDFFGLAERVIWATECEMHTGKHLNMEYGITEVVDEENEVLGYGKAGYLVGTSLLNYGMPMLRYRTSDISSISEDLCKCGRESVILDAVTTKAEDLIHTPNGKIISSSALTHPFKPLKYVEMSQIIQEQLDLIRIKIVKRPGYSESDTKVLLQEFSNRVGEDIKIKVEFVNNISREKSGKFKWVKSKLKK